MVALGTVYADAKMGADLQRGRPAIVQIATYSLAAVLFLGALAAFFELESRNTRALLEHRMAVDVREEFSVKLQT